MNPGLLKIIDMIWALFEDETQALTDEDFGSIQKIEMMEHLLVFSKLFNCNLDAKPLTLTLDNQENFDIALEKMMRLQLIEDASEFIVENGPQFILSTPFLDNIHTSLTKVKNSELIPVFKMIKGKFSFEICTYHTQKVLCSGKGSNGKWETSFSEMTVRLPKTLQDLSDFGHDLTLLFELSHDLDFIYKTTKL